MQSFTYKNITLAAPTTTVVKTISGVLHAITFNKPANTGVVSVYDGVSASGTLIATITHADAVPKTLFFDVVFAVGLCIVTATAAQDITVSYL